MANGDYGYFGKGDTGYAQYMTAFNRNFGGSSGSGGRAGAPWLRLERKYSIMVTEIPWVSEHEKSRHCGRKRGNEYESA